MRYEKDDNSAVRKTIIFPRSLWQRIQEFNKTFLFPSDVSAARFLVSYGLRTAPMKLETRYPEQDVRMYLNLSAALCNEISNFRFHHRLDAERDAILMLIDQGLANIYNSLEKR